MLKCELADAQQSAVLEEMNQILCHRTFKSSMHCVTLFRYLVESALFRSEEGIKERTLGVDVFGRSPDYDTSADAIVRKTTNEIRKRLALYYLEKNEYQAVRIQLDRGGYTPEFTFTFEGRPSDAIRQELEPPPELLVGDQPETRRVESSASSSSGRNKWLLGFGTALVIAACWLIGDRFYAFSNPDYKIWKPLLDSGNQINLCLAAPQGGPASNTDPQFAGTAVMSPTSGSNHIPPNGVWPPGKNDTPFLDAGVAQEVTSQLLMFKRHTELKSSSSLTFQDLHMRPTVLIGGPNNPWTSILLSSLRYTLRNDPVAKVRWIQDAQNPAMRDWKIDNKLQTASNFDDYAVITRFFDKQTGQWILALAGLKGHGTEAAGELVTDQAFAKLIPRSAVSKGNFQIVIKTSFVRGNSGPIEVLAVYSW